MIYYIPDPWKPLPGIFLLCGVEWIMGRPNGIVQYGTKLNFGSSYPLVARKVFKETIQKAVYSAGRNVLEKVPLGKGGRNHKHGI